VDVSFGMHSLSREDNIKIYHKEISRSTFVSFNPLHALNGAGIAQSL
jgi:hypothetical protein